MSELTKALCAARAETSGVVFKGGTNKHQNYPFVGHEHIIRHGGREALAKHGLSLLMVDIDLLKTDVPAGKIVVQLWQGLFQLRHSGGEVLELKYKATVQGNDKSAFVATTSLERVAMQRVLMLTGSSDEDVDHYESTDSPTFQAPEPQRTQSPPAGPPPIDEAVVKLIGQLELATADKLDPLLNQARGMFRSIYPHEREALMGAVDFAKARVDKAREDAHAAAAQQQGGAA